MIEKYYRRIIDGVPTAVIVADQNLNAVFTNPAFRNLFLSGKVKGSLGEVTRCANSGMRCGGKDCRGCPLYNAFDDAFCTNKTVNRRIYQKVRTDSVTRDVSYSLTVKPLGDGLCMGTIDDAYELEIAQELQTAKNIQQRLLPAGNWAGGKRYSYMYIPCRDIGGDLPDVFTVGSSACGMIADVSGKGISAGMLSAFVKAAYDKKEFSPAKAIANLNAKFAELNLDEKNYVTVAAVRIDGDSITYSTAGHNVPILLKTDSGITVIMLTEAAKLLIDSDPQEAKSKMISANIHAKNALDQMRESVHLLAGRAAAKPLREEIEEIIAQTLDGTELKIRYDLEDVAAGAEESRLLCNSLKECLSNGIRHGKATAFYVELKKVFSEICLYISDNGIGVNGEIKEGFGLKGMREKVEKLGGRCGFSSEAGEGFETEIALPLKKNNEKRV